MESQSGYLENYSFFDWKPVKRFEKWSTVFVSASAENNLNCVVFFLVCLLGWGGGEENVFSLYI